MNTMLIAEDALLQVSRDQRMALAAPPEFDRFGAMEQFIQEHRKHYPDHVRSSLSVVALVYAQFLRDPFALGTDLAELIGCSTRTVYRAVETLRSMGYDVKGQAGAGYYYRGKVSHMAKHT